VSELHDKAEELISEMRTMDRIAAYRHALKYAGYLPASVDLAVNRNREWIQSGEWDEDER
jgi:hypothetical protein